MVTAKGVGAGRRAADGTFFRGEEARVGDENTLGRPSPVAASSFVAADAELGLNDGTRAGSAQLRRMGSALRRK